jgi:hypothetical protein
MSITQEVRPAVKLLIESGMIPGDIVSQLVKWGHLPQSAEASIGTHRVSLESGRTIVENFLDKLNQLVDEDQEAVRETSFTYGRYQQVEIGGETVDLMIDGMGRIIVPEHIFCSGKVESVRLGSSREDHKILRAEPIFQGRETVAWALYLAK